MRLSTFLPAILAAASASASPVARHDAALSARGYECKVTPKVFIISMFDPEAEIWWGIPEFNLLEKNITVPGFSPLFPEAHCTADGEICQLVTGESEINAAVTISSLLQSPSFDLTSTYFLIAGIAGASPEVTTLGGVTFARFAVQVALQYEFDAREVPANWSTGYVPQGSLAPGEYPGELYGTEVFEVNDDLRKLAVGFAKTANLTDSTAAVAYRAKYVTEDGVYAAGASKPSVVECDVATSDVYYSGKILSEAFSNYTELITNGTGLYCTTAQEDNATLEAMMRGAVFGLVDYSRIIVMRTVSDFDRPYPGEAATYNLLYAEQGGYTPAVENIYNAGVKIVEGIIDGWNSTFKAGVTPSNYVGDIFGTLGGEPDFGPGSEFAGKGEMVKRGVKGRRSLKGKRGVPVRIA
ncbi:purine nucleoside permease [Saccharata proteae CBS 121410]|uniref:Purine nucleoside permease n=1 Tax=Saccharata proteae CBS 121410 TaxID=1314787 RepID=A0A9P4LYQ5_9PEZI|nr:purine nucleoside permease [Saccharata proteae CBS 121410]